MLSVTDRWTDWNAILIWRTTFMDECGRAVKKPGGLAITL